MKQLITIFIFLVSISTCFSNGIELDERDDIDLTASLSYYIDSTNSMSQSEAIELLDANLFIDSKSSNCLNFGSLIEPVWVSTELSVETNLDKVLHLKCPYLYYVDLYVFKDNKWIAYTPTGKKRPLADRGNFIARNFAWLLHLEKGTTIKVLMRVQSNAPTLIPLFIESEGHYLRTRTLAELLYGIYFGILLVMILYNAILYFNLRESTYLYYTLSIVCTLFIFSTSNGFVTKYVFPFSWEISYFLAEVFMCLIILPTSLFAINFLELKKYSKFSYLFLRVLCYASVPLLLIVLITESSNLASQVVGLLSIGLCLGGILAWKNGNPYAKYYVFAWSIYLIGGLAVVGRNVGMFPSNLITDNGAEIGSAIEVCLLAFALADKFRKMRIEKKILEQKHFLILEDQNSKLETQVEARTKDLNKAVEDLHETIGELNEKQLVIEEKNKNITSSINYALHIQQAILPDYKRLRDSFIDFTLFYKPKDIVSGDFLFFEEVGSKKILIAADCTGHGVPGAFMSMIGHNLLHEIIKTENITEPHFILEQLDRKMANRLRSNTNQVQDGMDLSVIQIDSEEGIIKFSGAKNGLLMIDKNGDKLYQKGDKRSVGDTDRKMQPFTLHKYSLEGLDWCYLYTDGFQDQFGGNDNRKYYSQNLKEYLFTIASQKGIDQMISLDTEFNTWKGSEDQLDDVTVVGFKI